MIPFLLTVTIPFGVCEIISLEIDSALFFKNGKQNSGSAKPL